MNQEQYMQDFMRVFEDLERWAPGSEKESVKALSLLPIEPENILEIGCGKGLSTALLAQNTKAHIVATDTELTAIQSTQSRCEKLGFADRVTVLNQSMDDLKFEENFFDLIWCEASVYVMGVEEALKSWRPLLKENGFLVYSDLVYLVDSPSQECLDFWSGEYPTMSTVVTSIERAQKLGFEVTQHFSFERSSWANYYDPIKSKLAELQSELHGSAALEDLRREVEIYEKFLGEFGYEFFLLRVIS